MLPFSELINITFNGTAWVDRKFPFLYIPAKLDVNNMHLPNEFYYFTGKCNSSTQNLNQIKEHFVQALNSSKFHGECIGILECQAKFVDVTCGSISSRRKRDLNSHIYRRSVSKFAYKLQFEFILPYKQVAGKTADDFFAENKHRLNKMSDVIQQEVDSGHFDLNVGDLHVESDSYGPGNPSMVCPPGTIARKESASCGIIIFLFFRKLYFS